MPGTWDFCYTQGCALHTGTPQHTRYEYSRTCSGVLIVSTSTVYVRQLLAEHSHKHYHPPRYGTTTITTRSTRYTSEILSSTTLSYYFLHELCYLYAQVNGFEWRFGYRKDDDGGGDGGVVVMNKICESISVNKSERKKKRKTKKRTVNLKRCASAQKPCVN